jgi:ubiquinol-cytochrome c reductase cytochrome c1 subunit
MMSRDLVNFLAYISEPSKLQRLALGKWVLLYLAIFFVIALALKKAYWKDVH